MDLIRTQLAFSCLRGEARLPHRWITKPGDARPERGALRRTLFQVRPQPSMLAEPRQAILSVGEDADLLLTRSLLLEFAGYQVFSRSCTAAMQEEVHDCDLVVVCHSVEAEQAQELLTQFRALYPTLPILRLTKGSALYSGASDHVLAGLEGPQRLLERIENMLRR